MFCLFLYFLFFKQKTAYEMRISDWSSDVCSSDLRQAGAVLGKAAVDGVDVEGRLPRPLRHHRHVGSFLRQRRIELGLELLQEGAPVAHGAVAEERHRAVRNAALGFHLRPPHAALAAADAVDVPGPGEDRSEERREGTEGVG